MKTMDRNSRWKWFLVLAGGAGGCVFDTGSFTLADGAPATIDLGTRDDAAAGDVPPLAPDVVGRMDVVDAATPDAATPDAATPDAAMPDAADVVDGGVDPTDAAASCDGASVDLTRDLANCGSCGNVCPTRANATASCVAGACGFACTAGSEDCNATGDDGCETDTRTSLTNCGRCGSICPAPANATATCAAGTCGLTCTDGFADCDGAAANGCEVDLRSDRAHCGTCATACATGQSCAARTCTCPTGQTLCAGACVNLQTDSAHCGACPTACAAGDVCRGGVCSRDCGTLTACGATCANLQTDPAHCGACPTVCPARPNAGPTCASGACGFSCSSGYADCNAVDGCETDVRTNVANCGRCGAACPGAANATAACSSGACRVTCNSGYADCTATAGCETDTRTSLANCGRCGNVCPAAPAQATATCSSSTCGFRCNSGYGDCTATAGCETNLNSDRYNCGACGRVCPSSRPVCRGGTCGCTGAICSRCSSGECRDDTLCTCL